MKCIPTLLINDLAPFTGTALEDTASIDAIILNIINNADNTDDILNYIQEHSISIANVDNINDLLYLTPNADVEDILLQLNLEREPLPIKDSIRKTIGLINKYVGVPKILMTTGDPQINGISIPNVIIGDVKDLIVIKSSDFSVINNTLLEYLYKKTFGKDQNKLAHLCKISNLYLDALIRRYNPETTAGQEEITKLEKLRATPNNILNLIIYNSEYLNMIQKSVPIRPDLHKTAYDELKYIINSLVRLNVDTPKPRYSDALIRFSLDNYSGVSTVIGELFSLLAASSLGLATGGTVSKFKFKTTDANSPTILSDTDRVIWIHPGISRISSPDIIDFETIYGTTIESNLSQLLALDGKTADNASEQANLRKEWIRSHEDKWRLLVLEYFDLAAEDAIMSNKLLLVSDLSILQFRNDKIDKIINIEQENLAERSISYSLSLTEDIILKSDINKVLEQINPTASEKILIVTEGTTMSDILNYGKSDLELLSEYGVEEQTAEDLDFYAALVNKDVNTTSEKFGVSILANIRNSDGTVYVGTDNSGEFGLTKKIANIVEMPILQLNPDNLTDETVQELSKWLHDNKIKILNVAGSSKLTSLQIKTFLDILKRALVLSLANISDTQLLDIQKEMESIKQQAIANGTFMKAPNGQPTKLNEEQWLLVRTKAFKKWFGDWEKYAKLNNATVIWGHPASGKTYLFKQGREDIIDFDSEYKVRINKIMGLPEGANAKELRKAARKARKQEYHDLIMKLFDEAKAEAQRTGKKLLVSDMMLLREREADIDVITNMSDEKFIERSAMRGETDTADKMLWKNDINDAMGKVSDKSKIINTEEFILDDLYGTNVSKVVDNKGEDATFEPKVMFRKDDVGKTIMGRQDGGSYFATDNMWVADSYGSRESSTLYKGFVNLKNPFFVRGEAHGFFLEYDGEDLTVQNAQSILMEDGYDGVYFERTYDKGDFGANEEEFDYDDPYKPDYWANNVAMFYPGQMKLTTDIGAYSTTDNNIENGENEKLDYITIRSVSTGEELTCLATVSALTNALYDKLLALDLIKQKTAPKDFVDTKKMTISLPHYLAEQLLTKGHGFGNRSITVKLGSKLGNLFTKLKKDQEVILKTTNKNGETVYIKATVHGPGSKITKANLKGDALDRWSKSENREKDYILKNFKEGSTRIYVTISTNPDVHRPLANKDYYVDTSRDAERVRRFHNATIIAKTILNGKHADDNSPVNDMQEYIDNVFIKCG